MERGEVWWTRFPEPIGVRPALLLSRNEAIEKRPVVTVARVTSRIRGLRVEVPIGPPEGLREPCVVNVDSLNTVDKSQLLNPAGRLSELKMLSVRRALMFALGFD